MWIISAFASTAPLPSRQKWISSQIQKNCFLNLQQQQWAWETTSQWFTGAALASLRFLPVTQMDSTLLPQWTSQCQGSAFCPHPTVSLPSSCFAWTTSHLGLGIEDFHDVPVGTQIDHCETFFRWSIIWQSIIRSEWKQLMKLAYYVLCRPTDNIPFCDSMVLFFLFHTMPSFSL